MLLQGEEELSWRGRATEAIGIIAEAIGVGPFGPHVQQILEAAFQVSLYDSHLGWQSLQEPLAVCPFSVI